MYTHFKNMTNNIPYLSLLILPHYLQSMTLKMTSKNDPRKEWELEKVEGSTIFSRDSDLTTNNVSPLVS